MHGIHTNAIYGFLNIYWMIEKEFDPDYVAVAFDLRAPTFRHKMYSEYKGTRKGMPDELKEQLPVIKEVLTAMNIPILEKEGYEADDILGTVANKNTKKEIFTYILTGDKDALQLISKTTSVINPTTRFGKTEYTVYTPEVLMQKQGIEPYQVVHIKSLMGDSSDNIPGVKGIGEKTAYSLIQKYVTLENIYNNIDKIEVTSKIKEKLTNDKEMAFLSQKLAKIDIDVPIDINYDSCKKSDVDLKKLYRLFKKLEFNKFLSKYDFSSVLTGIDEIDDKKDTNVEYDLTVEKIIKIDNKNFEEHKSEIFEVFKEDKVSYLFNGVCNEGFTPNIYLDNEKVIAFYSFSKNCIYVIDFTKINTDSLYKLLEEFAVSNCIKLGYNIKQDILFLFNSKINDVKNFSYDIMIAYYLMDSTRGNYLIDFIFSNLFDVEIKKTNVTKQKQLSFFEAELEDVTLTDDEIYNIVTYLKGIYLSYDIVYNKLKEFDMVKLFDEIEMPLVETLASMEHTGMYIDVAKLNKFDEEIKNSIADLEIKIYELAGENFNINSPSKLGVILFEKLKLPAKKKNKTGYSTDKTVLEELYLEHPIIEKILEYRQVTKLKSTYVDGLRDKIRNDGRIHTTFTQTITATGRLSSVEPNLQNIPVRMELGRKIRSFFTPQSEDDSLVDADYSQIELRVLSHISGDENMIDSFKKGIDIHKVTASQVFDVPIEKVDDTMRTRAKAVNFGIVYGISEFGLAKNISLSRKEAKQYIDTYLEKYNKIHDFMENIVKEATESGYVTTIFGRRRYIPELKQKNKNIVQFGKRVAMNTPIQGSAADIIKLAMNKVYRVLKEKKLNSKLIMQVHDELIIEASASEIDEVSKILKDTMENIVKLKVPLCVDLNVGKSWYDAK